MPTGVYPRVSEEERFWAKVNKTETCWLWTGALTEFGHGVFGLTKGVTRKAHRVAWYYTYGNWPKQLNHQCENANCVRTTHMYPGTPYENIHDSIDAGTFKSGRITTAKLTLDQAREIKRRYRKGQKPTQRELAAEYRVSDTAIYLIVKGINWPDA